MHCVLWLQKASIIFTTLVRMLVQNNLSPVILKQICESFTICSCNKILNLSLINASNSLTILSWRVVNFEAELRTCNLVKDFNYKMSSRKRNI
jgi:hypothetical protein